MTGPFVEALENHSGIRNRMNQSRKKLEEIRNEIQHHDPLSSPHISVFAAGSLGRLEAGEHSDFDVFMIGNPGAQNENKISKLHEYEIFASLIDINKKLKYPKFSGDGRFLKIYNLVEMVKATGSPRDDSENLFTARVLLLLESQPITNEKLYNTAIQNVISNYYRDGKGRNDFHPLFLLNDLLRYWRTLCLNYEEYRNQSDRPWLKKNLNLKFSRKLTIFSTVIYLLAGKANDQRSFEDACRKTPIERLATALDSIEDLKLIGEFSLALNDYENFLTAKEKSLVESENTATDKDDLTNAANRFGSFLHSIIDSPKINGNLRKYVMI